MMMNDEAVSRHMVPLWPKYQIKRPAINLMLVPHIVLALSSFKRLPMVIISPGGNFHFKSLFLL